MRIDTEGYTGAYYTGAYNPPPPPPPPRPSQAKPNLRFVYPPDGVYVGVTMSFYGQNFIPECVVVIDGNITCPTDFISENLLTAKACEVGQVLLICPVDPKYPVAWNTGTACTATQALLDPLDPWAPQALLDQMDPTAPQEIQDAQARQASPARRELLAPMVPEAPLALTVLRGPTECVAIPAKQDSLAMPEKRVPQGERVPRALLAMLEIWDLLDTLALLVCLVALDTQAQGASLATLASLAKQAKQASLASKAFLDPLALLAKKALQAFLDPLAQLATEALQAFLNKLARPAKKALQAPCGACDQSYCPEGGCKWEVASVSCTAETNFGQDLIFVSGFDIVDGYQVPGWCYNANDQMSALSTEMHVTETETQIDPDPDRDPDLGRDPQTRRPTVPQFH
eukprot:gene29078-32286_t